jgi:hypothetical protein
MVSGMNGKRKNEKLELLTFLPCTTITIEGRPHTILTIDNHPIIISIIIIIDSNHHLLHNSRLRITIINISSIINNRRNILLKKIRMTSNITLESHRPLILQRSIN